MSALCCGSVGCMQLMRRSAADCSKLALSSTQLHCFLTRVLFANPNPAEEALEV